MNIKLTKDYFSFTIYMLSTVIIRELSLGSWKFTPSGTRTRPRIWPRSTETYFVLNVERYLLARSDGYQTICKLGFKLRKPRSKAARLLRAGDSGIGRPAGLDEHGVTPFYLLQHLKNPLCHIPLSIFDVSFYETLFSFSLPHSFFPGPFTNIIP